MAVRGKPVILTAWLLFLAVAQIAVFVAVYRYFVLTADGQGLDFVALASNGLGADRLAGPVNTVLEAISIVAVAVSTCVIGFIALIRKRVALAVTSVVLIGGANLSAELLKHYLIRPDLGVDEARAGAGNSFPGGHTAIAASAVVALVLVLPPVARGVGAVIGSLYASLVGVATLSAGWHRPSDAVSSILLVGVWAAFAGILLRLLRRRGERVSDNESHKISCVVLTVLGVIALTVAIIGLRESYQVIGYDPGSLSTKRQAIAYLGGAAGILASACLTMALILLTVHRIVPKRTPVTSRATRAAKRPHTSRATRRPRAAGDGAAPRSAGGGKPGVGSARKGAAGKQARPANP